LFSDQSRRNPLRRIKFEDLLKIMIESSVADEPQHTRHLAQPGVIPAVKKPIRFADTWCKAESFYISSTQHLPIKCYFPNMLKGVSKAIQDSRTTRQSLERSLLDEISSSSDSLHALDGRKETADIKNSPVSVVISPNELNHSHGTGVLLNRIFPESSRFLSIRSFDHYGGQYPFGGRQILLRHDGCSRAESFRSVIKAVGKIEIDLVLLIPYHTSEWMTALALKHIYDAPLAIYVMDDTINVFNKVDFKLAKEVIELADICFAISREMADSYEKRFGVKFWVVPPLVPDDLICGDLSETRNSSSDIERDRGVLIGNAWCSAWLDKLGEVLLECNKHIDWYGGAFNKLHNINIEELTSRNIHYKGFVPTEASLARRLRDYDYFIMPGALHGDADQFKALSALSLPSRIPFVLSSANLPTLVLQDRPGAAGNFVESMGCGKAVAYLQIAEGIESILSPEIQKEARKNAARIAPVLSAKNFEQWLLQSIEKKEPIDNRFEDLMPRRADSLVRYNDWNVPEDLYGDFRDVFIFFRRLRRCGYKPDFVIDVGASVGIWSEAVHRSFPHSRFILIEPLLSRYEPAALSYYTCGRNFEFIEAAVSDRDGSISLNVSSDLYGSSILKVNDFRSYDSFEVPVRTLDSIAKELKINGRGALKLDVQYAEYLVLKGAPEFIKQIDVAIFEIGMVRRAEGAMLLHEFIELMEKHGFDYFDDLGGWRDPETGFLLEKDVVFVRRGVIDRAW
jgi:FkbM family methyltransferase